MEKPKVTILIATYNYEKYIGAAIESIIGQTYPGDKVEIIIIDDGSKDNTGLEVQKYASSCDLKYYYQENAGKAVATYKGVHYATGKYIFILDADDYFLPDCLSLVVDTYEQDSSIVQVSHLAYRYEVAADVKIPQTANHKMINKPYDGKALVWKQMFRNYHIGLGSTYSFRASIAKSIEIPADVDMYIDYYLFLKVALYGNIVQLDKLLSVFRRHSHSYSEGANQFEDSKRRKLRYLKSAQAVYFALRESGYSKSIVNFLKLFYLYHLLDTKKFVEKNYFKPTADYFFTLLKTLPFKKKKMGFLKSHVKVLFAK